MLNVCCVLVSSSVETDGNAADTDPTTKVMKPIELTVRDKCPSEERCGGAFKYKLDLSPAAFKLLSPNQTLDIGILEPLKWWFVDHRTVSGGGGGTGAEGADPQ